MDRVVVPPRSQLNVPVRLSWVAFERGVTKHTSPGEVLPRSLLPKEGSQPFVRAINLSDQSCNLPAELCVGSAYPAVVVGCRQSGLVPDPPVQDGS